MRVFLLLVFGLPTLLGVVVTALEFSLGAPIAPVELFAVWLIGVGVLGGVLGVVGLQARDRERRHAPLLSAVAERLSATWTPPAFWRRGVINARIDGMDIELFHYVSTRAPAQLACVIRSRCATDLAVATGEREVRVPGRFGRSDFTSRGEPALVLGAWRFWGLEPEPARAAAPALAAVTALKGWLVADHLRGELFTRVGLPMSPGKDEIASDYTAPDVDQVFGWIGAGLRAHEALIRSARESDAALDEGPS